MNNSNLEKANRLLQQGQIEEAIAEYHQCIQSKSDLSWSDYYYLGDILTELEDWQGAIEAYQQAISLNSNYLCCYRLAVALVKLEHWDEVIEVSNKGLALNPYYYKFYLLIGPALVNKQAWQLAIDAYRQAVVIQPEIIEFKLKLGQLLFHQERFEEAITYLQQAVDVNTDNPQLHLDLGLALVKVGTELNRAESCLRRSLQLEINQLDQAKAYFYLGQSSEKQGQIHESLGFYRRSWNLNKEVNSGLALAKILEKQKQWSDALEQYRQILFEFGESGNVVCGLGRALLALGQHMEAVVELRRAVRLGWDTPELYSSFAEALLKLNRWDELVVAWEKLLIFQPQNILVRRKLALTFMRLGRWSEAIKQWQVYRQVTPGSGQGKVLDFRQNLGYGEVPHSEELSIKGDLTVELWLYLRQWPSDWTNIIAKFVNDSQNEFCLRLKNGEEGQWYYGIGDSAIHPLLWIPQENIQLNQWVHIACIRKIGEYGKLYIDGILQGESNWQNNSEATATEAPIRLMVGYQLNEFLDGMLSNVRVWQVARTEDEIREGMYKKLSKQEEGLVAVWYGSEEGDILDTLGRYHGQIVQLLEPGNHLHRVGVCSWDLSHDVAERAYTLAQLYRKFAQVELIGSLFTQYGGQLWEGIQEMEIPCHTIRVKDDEQFIDQAVSMVLAHPYEVLHLSKPRMPNVIVGLLYKALWNTRVILDIDEEELALIKAEGTIDWRNLLGNGEHLPRWKNLNDCKWTQIAVGLAQEFDAVTVANPALQKNYGGVIIRQGSNEENFVPLEKRRLRNLSREWLGISHDKKVVIFFGIPNDYKSLMTIAESLASLGRQDITLVIVGNWTNTDLNEKLQTITGVDYVFIDNQSLEQIPNILAMGDCCLFFQDTNSPVSQFHVPRQLPDALGMGLVVLLSESVAVTDVINSGAVIRVTEDNLREAFSRVFSQSLELESLGALAQKFFMEEFTVRVNVSRLAKVLDSENNFVGKLSDGLNFLLKELPAVSNFFFIAGIILTFC